MRGWPGDCGTPGTRRCWSRCCSHPEMSRISPSFLLCPGLRAPPVSPCKHLLSQHFPSRDTAHGIGFVTITALSPSPLRALERRCDEPGPVFLLREIAGAMRGKKELQDKLQILERAPVGTQVSGASKTRATQNIPCGFPTSTRPA